MWLVNNADMNNNWPILKYKYQIKKVFKKSENENQKCCLGN